MRRSLSILLVFVLALMAVVPTFAQDEPGTIADIVVASAGGDTPEFTILLAAIQAADPAFLTLLSSPEGAFTVFAPTDAAFGALLEALETTPEDLLANTALLNQVLAYHVVPGAVFDAETIVGLDGAAIGTIAPGTPVMVSVDGDTVMINESTVVAADIAASNGVIHVIDAVLVPTVAEDAGAMEATMSDAGSLAEVVVGAAGADTPEFTVLLAAVQAADPAVLEMLSVNGPYTVFAPTDAAFTALLEAMETTPEDLLAQTDLLNTVLGYHVVPGVFTATDIVRLLSEAEEGIWLATATGDYLEITLDGETVYVNDSAVIATDVAANNGVVHVIDTVLLPEMEME
jgi:transforming growth factor-beta-induced protein